MKTRLIVVSTIALTLAISFGFVSTGEVQAQTTCSPSAVAVERIPYRAYVEINLKSGDDFITKSLFTVPAGKLFTAEHMMGHFMTDGSDTFYVQLTDSKTYELYAASTVTDNLFQGNQVGQIRTLNQPLKVDFQPGQHIIVAVQRSKDTGSTQAKIQLTGYLTDACPVRTAF
jgi:hypothetical protein